MLGWKYSRKGEKKASEPSLLNPDFLPGKEIQKFCDEFFNWTIWANYKGT